jgi:hypothetical protein
MFNIDHISPLINKQETPQPNTLNASFRQALQMTSIFVLAGFACFISTKAYLIYQAFEILKIILLLAQLIYVGNISLNKSFRRPR